MTDIVDVDALGTSGEDVSDLANCDTDVIQTPQPGVIVGVQRVAGKVLVKQPGGKFVPLTGATEIKVGSSVDTTHGTIKLIAGLGGGKTNSANFNDGQFKIQQPRAKNAYMPRRKVVKPRSSQEKSVSCERQWNRRAPAERAPKASPCSSLDRSTVGRDR